MLLVSGATSTLRPLFAERPDIFGVLSVPRDGNTLPEGVQWAADNGAFSGFDEPAFLAMLERHGPAWDRCLFVAAPDVVADAAQTLALYDAWAPRIAAYGYRVALVAQDGLKATRVPWSRVDAIFVGGSTEWKLSGDAALIVRRANDLGKWVHMGRVNTARRIHYAAVIGCDSIDGSGWSKWPRDMIRRHGKLLRDLSQQRRLTLETLAAEDRTP